MTTLTELKTALNGIADTLGEQRVSSRKSELTDAEKQAVKAVLKLMQDESEKIRDVGTVMMALSQEDFSNMPDDVAYPVRDAGVEVNKKITDILWGTFEKVAKKIIAKYGDQIDVKDFSHQI
jgi:hypothetical protein